MKTLVVWLLINVGGSTSYGSTSVVEHFDSQGECERIATYLRNVPAPPRLGCIEARIVLLR